MAINKKIEILQKGSPKWLKRFSAGTGKKLVKSRLKLNSLRDTKGSKRQSKAHEIQSLNVDSTVALVQENPIKFNNISTITSSVPHSEPDIPEIPMDIPPEDVPETPPQELPPQDPPELPQQDPHELPQQDPQELPQNEPQELP